MKTTLRFVAITFFVLLMGACRVYKPVEQPTEVLFSDNEIADYLSGYNVYMHNSDGIFRVNNVYTSGDTMYGYAVRVDSSALTTGKSKHHKNDMNIYMQDENIPLSDSTLVAIPKNNIKQVALMGFDGRASFIQSMSALSLLLMILIGLVLTIGLIGVSVWASAESADSSNTSSGNSSDSSSSDSGSSGSDSGSSGSDSGCYIATMVYGSYDAPEVWVLRRFRDNTLQKSGAGRWFVRWYYSWSPGFVQKYGKYNVIHRLAKSALEPLIWLLKK
ncbi:MAG TPA: CFI-box-CTERM domain-containing protein [Bacteroidia bacterium]|nr:CFI-box-CTERM domain-containing protein [Bacteroidia bacterium]